MVLCAISIQAGSSPTDVYSCPNKMPDNTIAWPGQHCSDPGDINNEAQCVSAGYVWGNYLCGQVHDYLRARWNTDPGLQAVKPLYLRSCCGVTDQACMCFLLGHHLRVHTN